MILVINAGSSSIKCRLYGPKERQLMDGLVERIGLPNPTVTIQKEDGTTVSHTPKTIPTHTAGIGQMLDAIRNMGYDLASIKTVGHRVVHGGERYTKPTRVTDTVFRTLQTQSALAPLHNPHNLAGIKACASLIPHAVQVAVFDTAFHNTIPAHAYMYALPWKFYEKHGIRKYGFHGISHDYITGEAARQLGIPRRRINLISCHLGSGCSVTAIKGGVSIDTSMGFTPLEGLTMATRTGDLDPAIPLHLMTTLGISAEEMIRIMNQESGLFGISGFKDLRDTLTTAGYAVKGYKKPKGITAETKHRATLAIDMFCYDVARYIGQYSAILGRVDAIVMTAGIGERSQIIRKRIMRFLAMPKPPSVLVIPTNEELMIARESSRIKE